jgi:hypothetical protein
LDTYNKILEHEGRIGALEGKHEEILMRQAQLDTANSAALVARLGEVAKEIVEERELNAALSLQVGEMRDLLGDLKTRIEDLEAGSLSLTEVGAEFANTSPRTTGNN